MMDTISKNRRSFILENENFEFSSKSKQIFEHSACTIHAVSRSFEVWSKLNGKIIIPRDEDFGLWAWSAYTIERAELIATELKTGKRRTQITWMEADE